MRRNRWLIAVVALQDCLGVAALAQTTTEIKDFEVVSVDGNKVVIKGAEGAKEITVPDGFQFNIGGEMLPVTALKPGMKGSATITTTTTTKPVYVTEVRNGEVLKTMAGAVIVRTDQGIKQFTQGDIDKRNIQIMRDGKPVQSEKVVEIVSPGQSFGEALMFLDKPYIVFAQALSDAMLLHVAKHAVLEELARDPQFARRMISGLARRLHGLVRDVEAYTLRSGRMTRSDAFFDRLVERRPAIGHALGVLFAMGGICLMAAIMAGAWPKWLTAWREGYYVGVIDVFTFPEWPLLLIIFIGCGLTALQFALLAVKSAISLCGTTPVGRSEPH